MQSDVIRNMLKYHLRNNKIWRILAQRDKEYDAHRLGRIAFQRMVVSLIESKTGYKLEADSAVSKPVLWSYTVGPLFYGMALRRACGELKNDDWQKDIVADTERGCVKYRNTILVDVPGKEEECRKNLIEAFQKISSCEEVSQMVKSYRELEEINLKARQAVEEIQILGLIPGLCKVCSRIGM